MPEKRTLALAHRDERQGKSPSTEAGDAAKTHAHTDVSPERSHAAHRARDHEGRSAASMVALSRHARTAAASHTQAERSTTGRASARTRGRTGMRHGRRS